MRQSPLPVYPAFRADSFETRGAGCPHGSGLREHMHWWCAPFLTWEPESKLWGQCRNASAVAGAGAASASARTQPVSDSGGIAAERQNLQIAGRPGR